MITDSTSNHQSDDLQSKAQQNEAIADSLAEIARMLADFHANDYRVRAYRSASQTLRELNVPVSDIYEDGGVDGLVAIPTIGVGIAKLIIQYLRLGRIEMVAQLTGWEKAEEVFAPIPGVGPEIAHHIYDHLATTTLDELREHVASGRLERVAGIGKKRMEQIQEYFDSLDEK